MQCLTKFKREAIILLMSFIPVLAIAAEGDTKKVAENANGVIGVVISILCGVSIVVCLFLGIKFSMALGGQQNTANVSKFGTLAGAIVAGLFGTFSIIALVVGDFFGGANNEVNLGKIGQFIVQIPL